MFSAAVRLMGTKSSHSPQLSDTTVTCSARILASMVGRIARLLGAMYVRQCASGAAPIATWMSRFTSTWPPFAVVPPLTLWSFVRMPVIPEPEVL